ncbi:hypothetical protein DFP72DRAFT_131063 [Ephemerocybe angulata]|uniref:Uncharacterized protein n=1 Tax=Ephemerocybe angulata TaxID=980116 RepID=A0A8H6HCI1_9AGAR|nr:hypothetical protein DFP72DRAFT_131063 [Tulosesus angulatus]
MRRSARAWAGDARVVRPCLSFFLSFLRFPSLLSSSYLLFHVCSWFIGERSTRRFAITLGLFELVGSCDLSVGRLVDDPVGTVLERLFRCIRLAVLRLALYLWLFSRVAPILC